MNQSVGVRFLQRLLLVVAILALLVPSSVFAQPPLSFDAYTQRNEKGLRALFNPVSRGWVKATYHVGKPTYVTIDYVKGLTSDVAIGASRFGVKGALGAALASLTRDGFMRLLRSHLENPQILAKDIGEAMMANVMQAYDQNYVRYRAGVEHLNAAEQRLFLDNLAAMDLYGPAKKLWETARKDKSSKYSQSQILQALAKVEDLFNHSGTIGRALLFSDIADALADSGTPLNEYQPLVDFFATKQRVDAYFSAIQTPGAVAGHLLQPVDVQNAEISKLVAFSPVNLSPQQAAQMLKYANLSLHVYGHLRDKEAARGWRVIAERHHAASGLDAVAYMNREQREIVIAFRGTEIGSRADRSTDVQQLVRIPAQYRLGAEFVRNIKKEHPGFDVVLTGHSLGGGIAQYAAGLLGAKGVIFNPAGLGRPAMSMLEKSRNASAAKIESVVATGYRIAISDLFDPETLQIYLKYTKRKKQDLISRVGKQIGRVYQVPIDTSGKLPVVEEYELHSMRGLRQAIMAMALAGVGGEGAHELVVVVDSSGSMKKTDPKDLRLTAIRTMIDTLDEQTVLSVVDFDSRTRSLFSRQRLGPFLGESRGRLKSLLSQVDSDGGTDITRGLNEAARHTGDHASLVLMTDGHDRGWKANHSLLPKGVRIHTIALSDEADREGLSRLSAESGGIHEIARTSYDLPRIMGMIFGFASNRDVILLKEGTLKQGEIIEYKVAIAGYSSAGSIDVTVAWPGSDIDLTLVSPSGKVVNIAQAVDTRTGIEAPTYDTIRLNQPEAGEWTVQVKGVQLDAAGEPYSLRVSGAGGSIRSRWSTRVVTPEVGQLMPIELQTETANVTWESAEITTWDPDGTQVREEKRLGGLAAVLGGSSGETVMNFKAQRQGVHRLQIITHGRTADGRKVMRTFDRTFQAVAPGKGVRYKHQIDPFIRRTETMLH